MKKAIKVLSVLALSIGFIHPMTSQAADKPVVVSFKMSPDTVDLATANTTVNFDLVVSNPTGISNTSTQVTLTDGGNNQLPVLLTRTDIPVVSKLSTVTFHGSIVIPANLPAGVYSASAKPITSLNADGSAGYSTDTIYATSASKVVGAEDSLLVRLNGNLNYSYSTFKGPSYDKTIGAVYTNSKFNSVAAPIWKVGESLNPADYYEMTIPGLALKVKANTTSYCTSDGSILKFIAVGSCSFTVYTEATSDYLSYKSERVATITSARTKPTFNVGTIATQSSDKLPLSVAGPLVYSPIGMVLPVSATPLICNPVGSYINVISGGTCKLNYSTPATADYLPSDVIPLTFEITRKAQSVTFSTPSTLALSSGSFVLSGSASTGLPVTYQTQTPSVCEVSGTKLNLKKAGNCQITALQVGSSTISPASVTQSIAITGVAAVKKIACIKNGKVKYFLSKKCPAGYKQKK